jgi:hypothetical protein
MEKIGHFMCRFLPPLFSVVSLVIFIFVSLIKSVLVCQILLNSSYKFAETLLYTNTNTLLISNTKIKRQKISEKKKIH